MANNQILPFATTEQTNALTDAQYSADAQRVSGHVRGIARSPLANKLARQVSLVASGVAQLTADNQASDVTDADTPSGFAAKLKAAVIAIISPLLALKVNKAGDTMTGLLSGTSISMSGHGSFEQDLDARAITARGLISGVGATLSSDLQAQNVTARAYAFAQSPANGEGGTKLTTLDWVREPAHLCRVDSADVHELTWGTTPALQSSKVNGATFLVLFGAGNTAMSSVVSYRTNVAQKGSVSADDVTRRLFYAICNESGFYGYTTGPELTGTQETQIQAVIRIH